MNRLYRCFAKKYVFLPVIHVIDYEQARRNTVLALDQGADGVFLINHEMDDVRPVSAQALLAIRRRLTAELKDSWIGVNCLDLSAREQFEHVPSDVSGIWADNAHVDDTDVGRLEANQINEARRAFQGLYFGSVAFKYQRAVRDEAATAHDAQQFVDIVTTSGTGTGKAASIEKIARMKQAIGINPLAIASGITPENIEAYLPYVDCYLVATGISHSFTELDPEKVSQLASLIARANV